MTNDTATRYLPAKSNGFFWRVPQFDYLHKARDESNLVSDVGIYHGDFDEYPPCPTESIMVHQARRIGQIYMTTTLNVD